MIDKIVGFNSDLDVVFLNKILEDLDRRLSRMDKTMPTASVVGASSHTLPIVIGGSTYYLMLTTTTP